MDSKEITSHFADLQRIAGHLTDAFVKEGGIEARSEFSNPIMQFFNAYPMAETTGLLIGLMIGALFFIKVFFPER